MSEYAADLHDGENRQSRRIKREELHVNGPKTKRAAFSTLTTNNTLRVQPFRTAKQSAVSDKNQDELKTLPAPYISKSLRESSSFTIHCDTEPQKISRDSATHHRLQIHPGVTGLVHVHSRQPLSVISQENFQNEIESDNEESPMVLDESTSESVKPEKLSPKDQIFSPQYAADIYCYLRTLETNYRAKPNYMRKQQDISPSMRSILIDWLVEVGEEYKLDGETLYLAINYIDRFLSSMAVLRGKLQLVGTACMFVAAKYQEIYPPDLAEFVYITDDTYTKKQVLRMEHLVLKVLAFDLAIPTPLYFLRRFCQLAEAREIVEYLSMYLCELTIMEADPYLRYYPSMIAASSLYLAQHMFNDPLWDTNMQMQTDYKPEDLRECVVNLHRSLRAAPRCQQQAVRDKYRSEKYLFVGDMNPPEYLPLLK
uniref:Uncharacterized protein n=1 Tax=Strigamia maritima TaxID=126957 RepID=T1J3G8_STRMM